MRAELDLRLELHVSVHGDVVSDVGGRVDSVVYVHLREKK